MLFQNFINDLYQDELINQDLQELFLRLININNTIKNKEESQNSINDDTYRYFIKVYDYIENYPLKDLKEQYKQYRELSINHESQILEYNKIKGKQLKFLKETFEYLYQDFESLQKKINTESIKNIRNKVFKNKITKNEEDNISLFLSELPARVNGIEEFIQKIYILGSIDTQKKIKRYIELHNNTSKDLLSILSNN